MVFKPEDVPIAQAVNQESNVENVMMARTVSSFERVSLNGDHLNRNIVALPNEGLGASASQVSNLEKKKDAGANPPFVPQHRHPLGQPFIPQHQHPLVPPFIPQHQHPLPMFGGYVAQNSAFGSFHHHHHPPHHHHHPFGRIHHHDHHGKPIENRKRKEPSEFESFAASAPDFDGKRPGRLMARFVRHVTIPENDQMLPNTRFTKTWLVRNESPFVWPDDCELVVVGGDAELISTCEKDCIILSGGVLPGESREIEIEMAAPEALGKYECFFRLREKNVGAKKQRKFGQRLWCSIIVTNRVGSENESSSSSEDEEEQEEALTSQKKEVGLTKRKERKLNRLRAKAERLRNKLFVVETKIQKLESMGGLSQ